MLTPEVYTEIPRRAMDLSDYVDVARRHRGWILGPIFAGLVIGIAVALVQPNTYKSEASLRITPPQISATILPQVLTQQLSDRINQMQEDILSRTSLSELITRLDLYKTEREKKPLDDVIEEMRSKGVHFQVVHLDSQGDRPASAFSLSFTYPDRFKAKAVVDSLVTRFMDSNYTGQRAAGTLTADFVHSEVAQAKADLDRLNNELTKFREENRGTLPEELQANAQALGSLQSQRNSIDEALNRDSQQQILLEGKLDELRSQKSTYTTLATTNDQSQQTGTGDRVRELNRAIAEAEVSLSAKKQIYTDANPDVIALQSTLDSLKKQRDNAEKEDEKLAAATNNQKSAPKRMSAGMQAQLSDMDGMSAMTRNQLKALELDRATKNKEMEQVNREIAQLQSRMEVGPANEQRYLQLSSDQQTANQRYQDLLRKQSMTEENQDAQGRKAGENLEVLDPASLPESPTNTHRWIALGIGFGLGCLLGLGMAALQELKDTSLKNLKDVRAYTQLPILSSIPLLENDLLVQRRRRVAYVSWSAALLAGVVVIGASMYYHYFVLHS